MSGRGTYRKDIIILKVLKWTLSSPAAHGSCRKVKITEVK